MGAQQKGEEEIERLIKEAVAKVTEQFKHQIDNLKQLAETAQRKAAEAAAQLSSFGNIGQLVKSAWEKITSLPGKVMSFIGDGVRNVMGFLKAGLKAVLAKIIDFVKSLLSVRVVSLLPNAARRAWNNLMREHYPFVKHEAMCFALTGKRPANGGDAELDSIHIPDALGGDAVAPLNEGDGNEDRTAGGCFKTMFGGGGANEPAPTEQDVDSQGGVSHGLFSALSGGISGIIDAFKNMPFVEDIIAFFREKFGSFFGDSGGSAAAHAAGVGH